MSANYIDWFYGDFGMYLKQEKLHLQEILA